LPQYDVERERIPFYLGGEWYGRLPAILDYDNWNSVIMGQDLSAGGEQVLVRVSQDIPVRFPFHRAFYDDDEVRLHAGENANRGARMANHAELYLE
jgi:hypothetical protein